MLLASTAVWAFGFAFVQAPAAVASVPVTPCGNGTASTTDPTTTCTYAFTGNEDTFTVPAGVTNVHVEAVGGWGGRFTKSDPAYNSFGDSGASRGAKVTADLAVAPGEPLYVAVAGNGGSIAWFGSDFGVGGFNGGGAGGIGIGCPTACRPIASYSGAGGGGASDVRTSSRSAGASSDDRLVVAAGGGGAGSETGLGTPLGYTGPSTSGGDAGSDGFDGRSTSFGTGHGGSAGTSTAGGAGGAGTSGGENGADGTLGSGGAGGGTGFAGGYPGYRGAGGGGGGYYGGGGGGSSAGSGGGGGGGSSFSSGSNVVIGRNSSDAAPYVAITYTVTAPALTSIAVTPAKPSIAAGTTQQLTATGTYSDNSTQDLTNQVTWASGDAAVASVASAGLVTGIGAGTTAISATDPAGTVTGSTDVTVPVTAPAAPTNVTATAGRRQATVSWAAPGSDGGSPITGYDITPYIGTVAQPVRRFGATATQQVVTGLTKGTTYTFKVAAVNAVGTGAQSSASNAVAPK